MNAREWYESRPESPGVLTWEPEVAEMSLAGDLGYTTGRWRFKEKPADLEPSASGHYVSFWRRRPDGSWRVTLDAGISHGAPAAPPGAIVLKGGRVPATSPAVEIEKAQAALLEVDRAASQASAERGAAEALLPLAVEDVRIYREDVFPAVGRPAAREALSDHASRVHWTPSAAVVAGSGDLGYTYGTGEETRPEEGREAARRKFAYLHIWRKETAAGWRLVLDLLSPIPPAPDGGW